MPAYVKRPIGTASSSVWRLRTAGDVRAAITGLEADGSLPEGVLVQAAVDGPLAMAQSVFAKGELVAWHANLRVRSGSAGGASNKLSVDVPEIGEHLAVLGKVLRWHGALSADAILTPDGPIYIDINPRIVEPMNALLSGVDQVGALLTVSCGQTPRLQRPGRAGVQTHQLLLAAMAAAANGRCAVLREFCAAATRTGAYRGSTEELTPLRGDPRSALPAAYLLGTILRDPRRATALTTGSVRNYALSPAGWRTLTTAGPADAYGSAPNCGAEP